MFSENLHFYYNIVCLVSMLINEITWHVYTIDFLFKIEENKGNKTEAKMKKKKREKNYNLQV